MTLTHDVESDRAVAYWPWWKVGLMWFGVPAVVWLALGGLYSAITADEGQTLLAVDGVRTEAAAPHSAHGPSHH